MIPYCRIIDLIDCSIQSMLAAVAPVVLVWLYIIRFSCSKKANEEQSLVLVLVSQLKRKKGY